MNKLSFKPININQILPISIRLFHNHYTSLFLGWLFSRFIFSPFRLLEIKQFVILPGLIVTLIFLVQCLYILINKPIKSNLSYFMTGILSDSFFYWIIRSGNHLTSDISDPWDKIVYIGSLLTLAVLTLFLLCCNEVGKRRQSIGRNVKRLHFYIALTAAVLSVLFFRTTYLFIQHLTNEERSLIISGYEIHHAVLGLISMIVINILLMTRCTTNNLLVFFLYGLASGFIIDQVLYIPLKNISDIAYNSPTSWLGALIGLGLFSSLMIRHISRVT